MKLYNTLTKQVEELERPQGRPLHLFVCGPTVYDHAHIGHARTYLVFDTFVRHLRAQGWEVTYLQNITDVDDKIIARAREQGVDPLLFARRFDDGFRDDMAALNITSVDTYARASEFIPEIVAQVETLRDKGFTYEIPEDGIYYDVSKFPDYGKLSNRTAAQAEDSVSRIDESVKKRNRADFCLWKYPKRQSDLPTTAALYTTLTTEDGEPAWFTPLGWGRPGWHIEDTAITEKFFGVQYDLHGGGVDIKFPHHEAEIAQQEAASGKTPFVKHWMHTGHLLMDGVKMSKSLNNFMTIRGLVAAEHPTVIRWMMLGAHYRSPMQFTSELPVNARAALAAIATFRTQLQHVVSAGVGADDPDLIGHCTAFEAAFVSALEDDFNTPAAQAALFAGIGMFQSRLWKLSKHDAQRVRTSVDSLTERLGMVFPDSAVPESVTTLAAEREQFRLHEQFTHADALRNEIHTLGYEVDDTPLGPLVRPANPFLLPSDATIETANPEAPTAGPRS